jgi:hypothetical protein
MRCSEGRHRVAVAIAAPPWPPSLSLGRQMVSALFEKLSSAKWRAKKIV